MTTFVYQAGPVDGEIHRFLNLYRNVNITAYTPWIGLLTTGPTASDGTGAIELTAALSNSGEYARQALSTPFSSAAASRQLLSQSDIIFRNSTGAAWNNGIAIYCFGIWSQQTPVGAGPTNLLWADEIIPQLTIATAGAQVKIAAGNLVLKSNPRPVTVILP